MDITELCNELCYWLRKYQRRPIVDVHCKNSHPFIELLTDDFHSSFLNDVLGCINSSCSKELFDLVSLRRGVLNPLYISFGYYQVLRLDSLYYDAHLKLADFFLGKSFYDDALCHYGRALNSMRVKKVNARELFPWNKAGRALYNCGKHKKAVDFFVMAKKISEEDNSNDGMLRGVAIDWIGRCYLGDPKTNEIYDPMKAHSIMSSENCFTPFREKRSKIYWRGISMLGHGDSVGYKYCMEKAGDWMCGSSIGCMYAGRARSRLGFYELSIELFEKSRLIHLNEISSSDPEREVFMDYCAFSDLRIDGWKGRALKELESPEMRALGERLESFAIENSWKEFQ